MSANPVILGCLSKVCQDALQMFERVNVLHESSSGPKPYSCYICLGKHHIYLVATHMGDLTEGRQLWYLYIDQAVADPATTRIFWLTLTSQRDSTWTGGDRIVLESQHRDMLLERIGLCWQAEHMFFHFQVKKFPLAKALQPNVGASERQKTKANIDLIQVQPFKGYEDGFRHRGYSFFLRTGFKNGPGPKNGTFLHGEGWQLKYNARDIVVPSGVEITVHVEDPRTIMELDGSATGEDDLRTVAMAYKQALTEHLDQFYVLANTAYSKRMNRMNDIAAWEGWEFFIRSKEYAFACVLFRREYIPPLCDTAQHIAVMLRCPAHNINQDMCEVIRDECCFVADSLASISEVKHPYREFIQARLDTLQFTEDAYRWIEGQLDMAPLHKRTHAIRFVKSIVKVLVDKDLLPDDEKIMEAEIFQEISALRDPLLVPKEMLSMGELYLPDHNKLSHNDRWNAWYRRISRYLAFCVDGGILGDRFTMSKLIQAIGTDQDTDKLLRKVVGFLLHALPDNAASSETFHDGEESLGKLLIDPDKFRDYRFNDRVMRLLLTENYIANEWSRNRPAEGSYNKLLAALLTCTHVGIGLRTLICRQILEMTNDRESKTKDGKAVNVLVPALVSVMHGNNTSLTSCATAALVNLSAGEAATKTLLVSGGCLKLCVKQLKAKDDDLTLYTLYLLVNLTKTPHHRSIVVREGGVPILVDVLTSSYQNVRKHKILTEVASVIGQLCNDAETRTQISHTYGQVVLCLLWIYDSAQPNTKLKAKLLFALRQLCVLGMNKIKVGQHVIPRVFDELLQATPSFEECAANSILLLTMLAGMQTNAMAMLDQDRMQDAWEALKEQKFSAPFWDKWDALKERVREASYAGAG